MSQEWAIEDIRKELEDLIDKNPYILAQTMQDIRQRILNPESKEYFTMLSKKKMSDIEEKQAIINQQEAEFESLK